MMKAACALICLWASPALALDPARTIAQYVHTAWTESEGAPADIRAIAQTSDGYLWLGTVTGLFRFDGVRFVQFQTQDGQPPAGTRIVSLLASRDGALWIVWGSARVSRLFHDQLTSYSDRDGLAPTQNVAESKDGALFAATANGLAQFVNGRWTDVGRRWGLSAGPVRVIYFDAGGTLWILADGGVQYLPAGESRFVVPGEPVKAAFNFAQAPDGAVWTSETGRSAHTVRRVGDRSPPTEVRVGAARVLFDRNGSLWVASYGDGLRRVSHPDRIRGQRVAQFGTEAEAFAAKDGLSSNFVRAALEDREGNLWFGTLKGLDRFRDGALTTIAIPHPDLPRGLVATRDGSLVAFSPLPVEVLSISPRGERQVVFRGSAAAMCEDGAGAVWNLANNMLYRFHQGQSATIPLPESSKLDQLGGIACDAAGGIWMADRNKGLFHFRDGSLDRIGRAAPGYSYLFADRRGRMWAAGPDRVALEDHGHFQEFGRSEGVPPGAVMMFFEDRAGRVWAGGDGGLSQFNGKGFRTVSTDTGFPARSVYGVAEDDDGNWWMASDAGVLRVPPGDLDRAVADRAYPLRYEQFDLHDGLPGHVRNDLPMPVVVKTSDGRIWFAASGGIAYVDPRRIANNTLSPPVHVEAMKADGREIAPRDGAGLSHGVNDIEIDYTALSLSIPERVRFRYQLEGSDDGWREAGARRQAYFNNLPPGRYHFRVVASTNSGVWNEAGATLDFSIAPAYYQTMWFRVAAVLAALALLWAAHRFRLRQVAYAFEGRLQERVNERTRIARELHDTLLQSFHGLLFRFQAATNTLPESDVKKQFESAIDQAALAIAEGRDAVQNLRASAVITNDLAVAISTLGEALAAAQNQAANAPPTVVDVAVEGTPRDLHPIIRDDIYRIAGEALRNAFRHADARRIEVEIRYDNEQLRVRVRDDGKGIDPVLLDDGRPGHFGIRGMRERAALVGGRLEVWSKAGLGTETELIIPAAAAYERPRARGLSWLLAGKTGTNS